MLDDITDNVTTRYGKPSWHTLENVGLSCGINDCTMLYLEIFRMLKRHFNEKTYYIKIIEAFSESASRCIIGQSQDVQLARKHVSEHTSDAYEEQCINKAGFVIFLPAILSMQVSGLNDHQMFRNSLPIFNLLSVHLQAQNDYTDVYGDDEISGRVGSDIRNGRCTVLTMMFNELASEAQKKVFSENYGSNEPEKGARVRDLYNEVRLPEAWKKREEKFKEQLLNAMEIPHCLPKPAIDAFIGVVLGRTVM